MDIDKGICVGAGKEREGAVSPHGESGSGTMGIPMCDDHSGVLVLVVVPAHLSWNGRDRIAFKGIDRCIATLVQALNDAGMTTVASCCGHGRQPGNIILADGREVFIAADFETARQVEKAFPPISEPTPASALTSRVESSPVVAQEVGHDSTEKSTENVVTDTIYGTKLVEYRRETGNLRVSEDDSACDSAEPCGYPWECYPFENDSPCPIAEAGHSDMHVCQLAKPHFPPAEHQCACGAILHPENPER